MLASNHLIGFGAVADSGTWQSVANNVSNLTSDQNGWASYTVRMFIPQASLAVTGGSLIRVTFVPAAATGSVCNAVYVGQASASYSVTSPAFAATPTQLLFTGSGTLTLVASGSNVTSDSASFSIPSSNGLLISAQTTAAAASLRTSAGSTPANWKFSYKAGADASTVAASGYADNTSTKGSGLVGIVETFA